MFYEVGGLLFWGLVVSLIVSGPHGSSFQLATWVSLLFEGGLPFPQGLLALFACSFNRLIGLERANVYGNGALLAPMSSNADRRGA